MTSIRYDGMLFNTIKDFYRHVKAKYGVKISYNFVYSAVSYRGLSPEEAVHEIINRDDTIISYGRKKFNSIESLYTFLNRFDKIKASYEVFARHYSALPAEEFRTRYNLNRKINSVSPNISDTINLVKGLKKNRFILMKLASQDFINSL
jgi:hypothetical protein